MSRGSTRPAPGVRRPNATKPTSGRPAAAKTDQAERVAPRARQSGNDDQVSPWDLDDPWENLHPARIWPD
jgi:hypothetical protein